MYDDLVHAIMRIINTNQVYRFQEKIEPFLAEKKIKYIFSEM